MQRIVDDFTVKNKIRFVISETEDEMVAKRFIDLDRAIFGKIKNITDKPMYSKT